MKTTLKEKKESNKAQPTNHHFKQWMGGEFLLNKKMIKWYPYFLLLFVIIGLLLVNERTFINKEEKIKKLETEYKQNINNLKNNNQFIPYEENQLLIQKLQEQGYEKDDSHLFRITTQDNNEK